MFVFIQKQYLGSFGFLFPTALKLLAHEVCKLLKK